MITGEGSWHLDNYKLPVKDQDTTMRNFPGYEKKQYLDLEDLKQGDTRGMTESDEDTSGKDDGPYTKLQEKTGGQKSKWNSKSSAKTKRYNSEKPIGFGEFAV